MTPSSSYTYLALVLSRLPHGPDAMDMPSAQFTQCDGNLTFEMGTAASRWKGYAQANRALSDALPCGLSLMFFFSFSK
jgi:hypothetical protein